jgi:acyl carrier protein
MVGKLNPDLRPPSSLRRVHLRPGRLPIVSPRIALDSAAPDGPASAGGQRLRIPTWLAAGGLAIELPHPLRYDGRTTSATNGASRGGWFREHPQCICKPPDGRRNVLSIKDLPMPSTFDTVANIIAETCDIPRDAIKLESHAINDLGIDSLDFLDVAFAIDKAFGIKMPLEQWTQEVNEGKATTEQYFVLKNLCAHIDALVAAKGA